MSNEKFEKGLKIRTQVLGEDYVNRSIQNADEFSKPLQELVTEYCWGHVWGRDGLSLKERSMINLAMISALNRVEADGLLAIGVHIERVAVAIQLAHEAGLAGRLIGDARFAVFALAQGIAGADCHALAAAAAAVAEDQLDHAVTSLASRAVTASRRTQGVSRPPLRRWASKWARRSGASLRWCMPRLSLRASALW